MKIILDAMGGDNAPEAAVLGAFDAAKTFGTEIILVGRGEAILEVMARRGADSLLYCPMKPVILTDPQTGK